MNERPDDRIDRLARRQHGAFSRRQALSNGVTARMIMRRLSLGRWLRLDHAVYALPSHPFTWERQAMAATLAVDGAVLSGRSAAALHGMQGFRRGGLEVTVQPYRKATTKLAVVRRSDFSQATKLEGIPVLTAAHTIISLAGRLAPAALEAVVDDALVRGIVGLNELQDALPHGHLDGEPA